MVAVYGRLVDEQTRCIHYRSPLDVVAIKFKCCERYYACYFCHRELESHPPACWSREEFGQPAILCGVCRAELSIEQYLSCGFACPSCGTAFNPGCANHYHLYFDL